MVFLWSNEEIAVVKTTAISSFGGPEEDRTPEPFGCEPNALPAELRAHISHFSIKKVAKNGFLGYSILREKSEKPDEKLEGKIGPVMEVHMDANVVRSQLRYRPKQLLHYTRYFENVKREFARSGEHSENWDCETGKSIVQYHIASVPAPARSKAALVGEIAVPCTRNPLQRG